VQPLGGPTEVKLLSQAEEYAYLTQLDLGPHCERTVHDPFSNWALFCAAAERTLFDQARRL
jgi:hypothetical protein